MKRKANNTDNKSNSMSYRTPADMHGDGVYFNEELLARKHEKELQNKKIGQKKS